MFAVYLLVHTGHISSVFSCLAFQLLSMFLFPLFILSALKAYWHIKAHFFFLTPQVFTSQARKWTKFVSLIPFPMHYSLNKVHSCILTALNVAAGRLAVGFKKSTATRTQKDVEVLEDLSTNAFSTCKVRNIRI